MVAVAVSWVAVTARQLTPEQRQTAIDVNLRIDAKAKELADTPLRPPRVVLTILFPNLFKKHSGPGAGAAKQRS
jgi:hypothetical protein